MGKAYQSGGFGGGSSSDFEGSCNTAGGSGGGYSGVVDRIALVMCIQDMEVDHTMQAKTRLILKALILEMGW